MEKQLDESHFSVGLNKQVSSRFEKFSCKIGGVASANVAVACNYFFDDPQTIFGLMDGYREMASLNRQITNEFMSCEDDVEWSLTRY